MPQGVTLVRKTLVLFSYGRLGRVVDIGCDFSGSFTVTAANSAGTADMTVSWEVACRE